MSRNNQDDRGKNTSSDRGQLGMGGGGSEDPRDINSPGKPAQDDRTVKTEGAFGKGPSKPAGGTPEL